MYITFDQLPETAKVWIYQADREFTSQEINELETILKNFVSQWQSHGTDLKASFQIHYQRFIVIGVDTNHYDASGCSIDKSVGLMRELEEKMNVKLLDRSKVAFLQEGKIRLAGLMEIKKLAQSGELLPTHRIFNNTVTDKKSLLSQWEVEASNSWLQKYFSK